MSNKNNCSWTPKIDEDVVVVVDRQMQVACRWSFPMRLGRVSAIALPHVKVSFTNGDTFTGHLEDLRPLMK